MALGFGEILATLSREGVEFIVVGGAAAVLQGAPVTTRDLDIVHRRTADNAARLARALEVLDAVYRHDSRRLRPNESHLVGPGHQLTESPHGALDCLGTIEDETVYEDLLPHAEILEIDGFGVQVLSLERLIEVKRKLDRPKDKLMLLQLEATLRERGRQT
jgi:predicted nucleotidyltransferase